MWAVFSDNPTREKILMLLKRKGPLSIEALTKELNITSMGIRQHLLSLERRGLIDYATRRQGIGRPAFLYKLTEKADALFPRTYDQFILNLLRDVEDHEGREKVDETFKWRKNRMLKDFKDSLADKKTVRDKLYGLNDILASEGYLPEIQDSDNHYALKIFNCPVFKIGFEYRDTCRYDLQTFRDLFGKDVTREECIIDGDASCTYIIPKGLSR